MNTELKNINLVLVGRFNPLEFDKYFFIKNGIFQDGEISDKSFFADDQAVVRSKNITILILFDRIQFTANSEDKENELSAIANKLIAIFNTSHSVRAIGINFQWFVKVEGEALENFSRKVFYSGSIPLLDKFFNTEDAAFGTYVSKNVKDARLRLEVKPATNLNISTKEQENVLNWMFNFHIESENGINQTQLIGYIQDFNFYKNESSNIISIVK